MAKRLQLIDFKSQGDEKPLEYDCKDDKATILDVKRFVDEEEGLMLKDLTKIQIYWLFAPLQDDVSVKDLLDQNVTELYVSLPQYASITSNVETMVFSKEKNMFNQGVNKKSKKLHLGSTEEFEIPKGGKFAVMRNKMQGKEKSYFVDYYAVEDDWKIEIDVNREDQNIFEVFQVLENGDKKKLAPEKTKEFSIEEGGKIQLNGEFFATAAPYFKGVCKIVAAVIEFFGEA